MPHPLRLAGSLALALAALPLAPTAARAAQDPSEILAAARARAAAGDAAGADAHYRRLLAEAPGSRFAGDAHLAIAERHFEAGRMTLALTHYEAVERIAGAESMVGYAIYKQGWCHMNAGRPREALATFERVVRHVDALPRPHRQAETLRTEARKDYAKAWALVGPEDGAWRAFQRLGGPDAPKMLERLADVYRERGLRGPAAETYRELMAIESNSPRLCEWQGRIAGLAIGGDARAEVVAEVERLGATVARVRGLEGASAESRLACAKIHRDLVKEAALLWHERGRKEKDPEAYAIADPLYRQFLAHYEKEAGAYDMAFQHAEALWNLGRWEDAAAAYERVLRMNPKGARTQDAAYAFVLARKNALRVDDAGQATGASGEEIARRQRKLVEAFDAYLRYVPNGPEVAKIKFRRARAFYEMNDHAAAAPAFVALADAHPDDELAVYAQNLHLDSLNLLRRRDDLCAAAARFAGSPAARRDAEHARGLARIAADCGKRGAAMPGPGARR